MSSTDTRTTRQLSRKTGRATTTSKRPVRTVPTLASYERKIEEAERRVGRGLADAGLALKAIRDGKLYTEKTFEAYVEARWDMSRQRAYQLIDYADMTTIVDKIEDPTIAAQFNEGQARALLPLKGNPDMIRKAFEAASQATNGRPTAKAITSQVDKVIEPEETEPKETGVKPNAADRAANDAHLAVEQLVQKTSRLSDQGWRIFASMQNLLSEYAKKAQSN